MQRGSRCWSSLTARRRLIMQPCRRWPWPGLWHGRASRHPLPARLRWDKCASCLVQSRSSSTLKIERHSTGSARRKALNGIFSRRSSVSSFIHAHLFKSVFEMDQAESQTRFDCAERNLHSLGNFGVGPPLEVGKLDHHSLFGRNLPQRCANLATLHCPPNFPPNLANSVAPT